MAASSYSSRARQLAQYYAICGFVFFFGLTAPGRSDEQKPFLVIDFIPFATDQTENLFLTDSNATLTTFFRYQQRVVSQYDMTIDLGMFLRLGEALKKTAAARVDDKAATGLGPDKLVFCPGIEPAPAQPKSVLANRVSEELLALFQDTRKKGRPRKKETRHWVRSIPFVPAGSEPPKVVTQTDFRNETWTIITESIQVPMHFVPTAEAVYRNLIFALAGKRQVVVFHKGCYFDTLLYDGDLPPAPRN